MNHPVDNVEKMRPLRFNSVWLVPVIAALIAGWMVYQNWSEQGPEITLVATNAEGLEVGKTKVKARNVDVGEVTDIRLSDNYEQALITVQMHHSAEQMLHEDAKFWVIKPRVGKEGVSGLGTLLSGAYIEMEPGAKGELIDQFTMQEQPPLSTSEDKGIRLHLYSNDSAQLDVGTPVHFRGYEVGYIEQVDFDLDNGAITYRVFIQAPYDSLVTTAVQFWMTPGFALKSTARGVEVKLDSLETLLSGGITFGTTQHKTEGSPVADLTKFRLYASRDEAVNNRYDQFINYVFMFNATISGLEVGAPVEFRGVRIGTVKEVPYLGKGMDDWSSFDQGVIPVLARIEPQRLDIDFQDRNTALTKWQAMINQSIKKGLRASLKTSNYLTGAKVINLDFFNQPTSVATTTRYEGYPIFPTMPDSFEQLEVKLGNLLDKLTQLPMKEVLSSAGTTLNKANDTFEKMQQLSDSLHQLLNDPATKGLPRQLSSVMTELDQTLATYQEHGELGGKLGTDLDALERMLNELQPLLRQLRQQPNALIFDSQKHPDKVPPAADAAQENN